MTLMKLRTTYPIENMDFYVGHDIGNRGMQNAEGSAQKGRKDYGKGSN